MSGWTISQNPSESLVIDIHRAATSSDEFTGMATTESLDFVL
jgi:hypothetical protein